MRRDAIKFTVASREMRTTLEGRRLRKECQDEKTAPGAAGSDGGVTGKLKASSSSDLPEGDAGSAVFTAENLPG